MKILKNPKYILVTCSVLFFVIYSYLALISPDKFVSPDETTNYHFTQLYAQTGELRYSEDLNNIAEGIIHPRGAVYTDGYVTSGKFIGFQVMNGTIAILIPEIIRFLTPLLAVVGALFFYLLVRDMFNRQIALFSYLLLLVFPTYFYWSSLSMFENISGCAMLIISLRYFFKSIKSGNLSYYVLFGLFLGFSLFIRPDFVFFLLPVGVIVLWNIKSIKKGHIICAFLVFLVSFAPLLIMNNTLYGSPLLTGQHIQTGTTQTFLGAEFNIGNLYSNVINLISLTPVIFISILFGLIIWLRNNNIKSTYLVFSVIGLLIFSLYYLDDKVIETNIHSSYGRYLLPASILFIPFLPYFLLKLRSKIIPVVLIIVIVILSISTVAPFIESNQQSVKGYESIGQEVAEATEPDAVIFLTYWDKAIYPERRVAIVSELPEENLPEDFSDIAIRVYDEGVPVYVFYKIELTEIVTKETMDELLATRGFRLQETSVANLYKLTKTGL